jgi:hypothetical protein
MFLKPLLSLSPPKADSKGTASTAEAKGKGGVRRVGFYETCIKYEEECCCRICFLLRSP